MDMTPLAPSAPSPDAAAMAAIAPSTARQRVSTPRHDGWTPERQRIFLEYIADGHTVRTASFAASMSHQSAYQFRRRVARRTPDRSRHDR